MTALVRAALLADYPDLAIACGLDPRAQLRAVELDRVAFGNPDLFIPAERVAQLLDNSARASGHEDIGVQLAMRRNLAHLGVSSLLISQQPTLRAALAMAEQYRHLLNETLYVQIERHEGLAVLRCDLAFAGARTARQFSELAVATVVQLFRVILGQYWHPQTAAFVHPAPADTLSHRRFFACPVDFNQHFNGFTFAERDLDRPNPAAQTQLAQHARILLDSLPHGPASDLDERLRRTLILLLPIGRAGIDSAAAALGTSARTLQRDLAHRETSFSQELDRVRRDLAVRYLSEPRLTVGQIAEQLGYAGAPAFIRWFRGAFGTTPERWRQDGARPPA